ncbi:Alpha-1,4-glucan:maltose-1-phosphate maltosyltransferase 2 [Sedimentisphaera cyanobacteriorum]|uniref:Alpha-1,4-glucan:maltose-1-phosphate maltosyltransferase 2 n=1 Tax=Sedimentisphaera cyanobacteriorum TaxID=1940790 RepID=A0A1Q2HNZ5_9BACT|nr:amylo-alpha-1,6-glucosidase [Sedimentisphaera cyanobacteriorum]AQQ09004.1 Alpha-1,4-glucan:maltose-1-phosphate maltosyltransferase 2 [Sedimentisphaera cyanobacteriorum]
MKITQTPSPGTNILKHEGDTVKFILKVPDNLKGQAYLRSNLFRAHQQREQIIESVEKGKEVLGKDWHDIKMLHKGKGVYEAELTLTETGCFSAKTLFISEGEKPKVYWPEGDNANIKIEPAFTFGGNTIYSVFPRLFGINKYQKQTADEDQLEDLDSRGYTVIPPSGTFRDVIKELEHIIAELGFKIIQLLPVHPIPTTFARMGRYGSPFAAKDFFDVDHGSAEFDKSASPMKQFEELVDQIHFREGKVFLDLPANHTGWASQIQEHFPQWVKKNENREFVSPGAWGVEWADLCELDYSSNGLCKYMAEVFLFWCSKGVDGFRCDAGYMIPLDVWRYITARVREEYPHTIFLLEGLGGPLETTKDLLTKGNLNWAYSELFQNYSREQIEGYAQFFLDTSLNLGTLVNFAETHDNNRLAASGKNFSILRNLLCAMLSDCGSYGITCGVEWLADEKIDVHNCSSLNWDSRDNIKDTVKNAVRIITNHPCFQAGTERRFIHTGEENSIAMLRQAPGGKELLILSNLDSDNESSVQWSCKDFADSEDKLVNLLTEEQKNYFTENQTAKIKLSAGEVLCLSRSAEYQQFNQQRNTIPEHTKQIAKARVMQIWQSLNEESDCSKIDFSRLGDQFINSPEDTINKLLEESGHPNKTVHWKAPEDSRRNVILPAEHLLYVTAESPFLAEIKSCGKVFERHYSIQCGEKKYIAAFNPMEEPGQVENFDFNLRLFKETPILLEAKLVCPPAEAPVKICLDKDYEDIRDRSDYAICSNEIGSMAQVRSRWGEIASKYDTLFAANLNPDFPTDRIASLVRCRVWLRYRDYSTPLEASCQKSFTTDMENRILWEFQAPAGMGKMVPFKIILDFSQTANTAVLRFSRPEADNSGLCLNDGEQVRVIVRPDVDARLCHMVTKAYKGPERDYEKMKNHTKRKLIFSHSQNYRLTLESEKGNFTPQSEWKYMNNLPIEEQRGLESTTDLFSPGYFSFNLAGGEHSGLCIAVNEDKPKAFSEVKEPESGLEYKIQSLLKTALKRYIVRRGEFSTVLAGFPWFLDWGRDTLIALRGFIAAGFYEQSRKIILQFAKFEEGGTLPNMIRGEDVSNRDTSDAPLWLFAAVKEYISYCSKDILKEKVGGRTLLEVLESIAENYHRGTANGIKMDEQSGLIFSPSHFTWMDTNYPASTPREGYPVEIQALWEAALRFLSQTETKNPSRWAKLGEKVRENISVLYENKNGLSDCLHCTAGTPASEAKADDHCRCNQLFAVTLGALTDKRLAEKILQNCQRLLVPGGIRSLADEPVEYELAVKDDSGRPLNDAGCPYKGIYGGDEDTSRKPAYHNGTAWGWVLPSYCEGLAMVHGSSGISTAKAIIKAASQTIQTGCIGHLPEILDGNAPHHQRGCKAQAWSVSEFYRIAKTLEI